jgi:hypothetical protein
MEDEARRAAAEFIVFAEGEVAKLIEELKRFDDVQLKLSEWQAVIEKTRKLTGISTENRRDASGLNKEVMPVSKALAGVVRQRKRKKLPGGALRDKAEKLLRDSGHSMKTPEFAERIYGGEWKETNKNACQILRGMFKTNQDVFSKMNEGEYELVEWKIQKYNLIAR